MKRMTVNCGARFFVSSSEERGRRIAGGRPGANGAHDLDISDAGVGGIDREPLTWYLLG